MNDSPSPSSASFVPEQDLSKNRTDSSTTRSDSRTRASATTSAATSPTTGTRKSTTAVASPTSPTPRNSAVVNHDDDLGFDDAAHLGSDEDLIGPLSFTKEKYQAMVKNLKVSHWHETRHQLKTIHNVQSGEELTMWFMTNGYVANTKDACELGNFLISQHVLYPMLRRLAVKGFQNSNDLFYMLTPERQEKNVMANAFSKVRDRVTKNATAGTAANPFLTGNDTVKYEPSGYMVEAIIYEYERYSGTMADGLQFSKDNLNTEKFGDPQNFSIHPDEVPVPSVGGASADRCEWQDEWVQKVEEGKTSPEGWMYGSSFADIVNNHSAVFNVHDHRVRARAWVRKAQQIPDNSVITVEEEAPKTKKEIEEEAHREMLARIEQARRARQKFYFQWTVESVQIKEHLAPSSVFVVVEHFSTRQRSNAAPQRVGSDPGYLDFPLRDCTGQFEVASTQIVGFAVWANLSLGRKQQLGYASFLVPEQKNDERVELKDVIADVTDKENTVVGVVKFEYGTAPMPPGDDDMASVDGETGEVINPSQRASAMLHTPHCVLELSIVQLDRVDDRIINRSRGSRFRCLAFFAPSGEPKAFLRIKYRGLVSNMTLESKRVIVSETTRFDFSTVLAVRHLIPVVIEVWYEKGSPGNMTQELVGEVKLEFVRSGLETCTSEKPVLAAQDVARKIYEQQVAALPAEAKPKVPPPPQNPKLEELLNQVRRSQQQRDSLMMEKDGGKSGRASSNAAAADPQSPQEEKQPLQDKDNNNAENNLYGSLNDDLSELGPGAAAAKKNIVESDPNGVLAQKEKEEKEKQGLIPSLMTKACNMNIRYKYIVEGEAESVMLDTENIKEIIERVEGVSKDPSRRVSRRPSGDFDDVQGSSNRNSLLSDTNNNTNAKPSAAAAAASSSK